MPKILVVDDELSIRESFKLILEGKYQLVTAASGEAALEQVRNGKIELVYLDIRMPGMTGLETLPKLKEIDPALDIVMVTAVNEVGKASEAIKLGARDYLIKPFNVDAILKMTEIILRQRSLRNFYQLLQEKPPVVETGPVATADLPALIKYYLEFFSAKYNLSSKEVSSQAAEILALYNWPGDKVELANLLETLVLTTAGDKIEKCDLPFNLLQKSGQPFDCDYLTYFAKNATSSAFGG